MLFKSLGCVGLFMTPQTAACQAPLPMEVPFPIPGDLSDPGIEPEFLASPVLAGGFFTTSTTWEAQIIIKC